ncbi:MAG TPA: C69 family dipeptidase [Candidatus Deferrimicrobium sp.]|nr:C69 family dipeptidase [Candidatus Deferrimicrobium sp.]
MKSIIHFISIITCQFMLTTFFLCAESNNGFTIIVGKDAGGAGAVMVAHNEDEAGKNLFVDVHIIPPGVHLNGEVIALKNNPAIPQVTMTYGFLRLQVSNIDFSDSYINREGVVMTSNACKSREDRPEFTAGGIDLLLPRLAVERASSARETVEIAGRLLDTYGYYASGRSYAIADANEAWLLQVVSGKHWVAQRIPDDQAAVTTNCYTIETVNLQDKNNFMGSADLVDYAIKRRWYQPDLDGPFNFAKVYAAPGNIENKKNTLRRWRAVNLLTKNACKINSPFPFAFSVPKKSITLTNLFRILRDHYEDTEYDITDNYKKGSPNAMINRPICSDSTRYSFIAELRTGFPVEIANRMWVAFRRPDSNAYSPWYASMTVLPDGYTIDKSGALPKNYSPQPQSPINLTTDYAYRHYAKLSDLVDQDYKSRIKPVIKEWENFEDYALKSLKKMEKEFHYLLKTDKYIAEKIITNYIHRLEYRKWFLTAQLIQQLEKKVDPR